VPGIKAKRLLRRPTRSVYGFVAALAAVSALLATTQACAGGELTGDYSVASDWSPHRVKTGEPVTLSVDLRKGHEEVPWAGAKLEVQAHMTHPGMAPVIAPAIAGDDGRYKASLTLTMAGDWKLFVVGTLPDGRAVKESLPDIPVLPEG
jgi:hypothetical protein